MNIFHLTYKRFYRVQKILINVKLVPLAKVLSNKNILKIGLLPVIPTISAQSLSIKEGKSDNSSNANIINNKEEKTFYVPDEKTPWERVKAIYETDEFGNYSKELTATFQACWMAAVVGFIYGGVQKSRVAFVDFMERNQATLFENHIDAKRKLQNHVTIHFGKGAFQWAWRMSMFTGGFMLLFLTFHAYRGTTSLKDYAVSGAIVGAVMRIKLGPPGIIIGGTLGGVLGFVCGVANQTMFSLVGASFDDVLEHQYKFDRDRHKILEIQGAKELEESGGVPKAAIEMLKSRDNEKKDI